MLLKLLHRWCKKAKGKVQKLIAEEAADKLKKLRRIIM